MSELELLGRMQDLIREEAELLAVPPDARTAEQHARLAAIGQQLDQMWEALRARAEREPAADSTT